MPADPAGVLHRLVRDGVPEPVVGPDGRPRPPLPLGTRVPLAGRGTTFVREVPGPPGAPTLVLLHGLLASGGLNWFRAFEALGSEFRVLAPDLRGHARGLRSRGRFRLQDCADDLAALLAALGVGPVVVVGYSMGGPIAQLLWRRHPERVSGLVLCATAPRLVFGPVNGRPVDAMLGTLAGAARVGGWLAHVPSVPLRSLRRGARVATDGLRGVGAGRVAPSRPPDARRGRARGARLRRQLVASRDRCADRGRGHDARPGDSATAAARIGRDSRVLRVRARRWTCRVHPSALRRAPPRRLPSGRHAARPTSGALGCLAELVERVGHSLGDSPRVIDDVGTRRDSDVHGIDVAQDRDVEAAPDEERTERVRGEQAGPARVDRQRLVPAHSRRWR